MDKNKILSEELLKIDGIDPTQISDTERAMFKTMLDKEMKHHKQLSWYSTIFMWIFALAMLGLCMSEEILQKLHIPFVAAFAVLIIGVYVALFLFLPKHYKQIKGSGEKVQKLHFLVHGKYRGFPLVGKKNDKRYIDWLSIILLAAAIWFFMSLGGAGVYYLLCRRWIYSGPLPYYHIFLTTIASLSFVTLMIYRGLKAPLEELTEIKTENYTCSRRKFSFVTMAIIISIVSTGIYFSNGKLTFTNVALSDVVKKLEQTKKCIFKKTTNMFSEDNSTNTYDSLVYFTKGSIREDIYDNEIITNQVYIVFSEGVIVAIDHQTKLFTEMNLADEDIENEKKSSVISPGNIVNLMLSEEKYIKLGRKTINGILSEGFEFDDKSALLSTDKDMVENIVTRLWIDVKTNLPVRIEADSDLINNIKVNMVMFEPQWNVELEEDFFEPKIPEGYILPEERGYVGINLLNWPDIKVSPGMPAGKAGIKEGDIILKINDNIITESTTSSDAMDMLFGKIGEKDIITVRRGEQTLVFEVEKAALPK